MVAGYDLAEENVVAIARLRGPKLKKFEVPMSCVSSLQEEGEEILINQGCVHDDFFRKVSIASLLQIACLTSVAFEAKCARTRFEEMLFLPMFTDHGAI